MNLKSKVYKPVMFNVFNQEQSILAYLELEVSRYLEGFERTREIFQNFNLNCTN